METNIEPLFPSDGQIVEAVQRGDTERYRELVERHERRVYAVAWSRLGDSTLAEDAAQEAFIRGYRHLKLLENDPASTERALGQVSDAEVFVTPSARTAATRLWIIFALVVTVLMLVFSFRR